MIPRMELTLGPILFHWPADRILAFYDRIAEAAPIDRVVIGETVCSKREPITADALAEAAERLRRAGKTVMTSSLILPTLKRERSALAALMRGDAPVEINDLSALRSLPPGRPFSVGPLVNVYNESTLGWLAARGATAVCLPPEMPLAGVAALTGRGPAIEVWAHGRAPLAISARCYHARLEGRTKDACQFVCEMDADGRAVDTLDGQRFLAVNGVMTMSESWVALAGDIPALAAAGVSRLRLSPHSGDMAAVAQVYRDAADDKIGGAEALARLAALEPGRSRSNGFLFGRAGADWIHAQA